jgi:predicted Rossmann fold nucleotide-binding protein DprA/Smf involved in DNA uptake
MGVMSTTEDLRRSLQARLEELEREASRVRDALQALDGGSPKPRATEASPEPPPATITKPTRTRRTRRKKVQAQPTEVVPAGKLEKLLAQSDGISTADLAKQAHAEPDQVLALLRELEAAGKVRRTGQRRGTRWHAVS